MKAKVSKEYIKPLVFLIPVDILLIILRWFLPLNFNTSSPSAMMKILGLLITIAVFIISFVVLLAFAGIVFDLSAQRVFEKPTGDGTSIILKGIGKFFYSNSRAHGYCKAETLSLFGKKYRIDIIMRVDSKAASITPEQIQAYHLFVDNCIKNQAELESTLLAQKYDKIFAPAELTIDSSGHYELKAMDTASGVNYLEFIVTFNPISIIHRQMDYNERNSRYH